MKYYIKINMSNKQVKFLSTLIFALFIILLFVFLTSMKVTGNESKKMTKTYEFTKEFEGIKEYSFSNGLKVLLKQNHSIPLVTFSIWYKVGSRNESDGTRGLAHFLEHMMFKGTKKFKKGEISDIIQACGGVFNAFTFSDGTAYYETVSPQYLEKMVEIEADRMRNSILDPKELELEKNVVISELEGSLNNPSTFLDQEVRFTAYEKHPYKHPVIGYKKDIESITPDIVRKFYEKYYSPNNATIILVGDFNENRALNLIEKYFGNYKKSANTKFELTPDQLQKKEKRITVKKSGTTKLVEVVYHIPSIKDKDIYPLNIIEEILIKGTKSKLKEALIEKGLATEVSGGAEANTDPGLFYIVTSLTPKAKHKDVEKIIVGEIKKLVQNPPKENEIQGAKNRIKASYLFNLDGTYNQAINLGFFEIIDVWNQAINWPRLIDKVTKDEVSKALSKYFQDKNKVVGYFIPVLKKGEHYETKPIDLSRTHNLYKLTQQANLQTTVKDTSNKSTITNKNQPSAFSSFNYDKKVLKDGSTLLIYDKIDIPITIISGIYKGGVSLVSKDKEWECELITRLLEKGSKKYQKKDIENFLDYYGSQFSFACDEESFKYKAITLNEHTHKTLDILLDILINPTFPENEIKKEKEKAIAETIELQENTSEIAKRNLTQLIYPKEHVYHIDNFEDDIKNIKKVKKTSIEEVHNKLIKNNKPIISIVTNVKKNDLEKIINKIESNMRTDNEKHAAVINIPDTKIKLKNEIKISYLKDKTQSDVFLGHAGKLRRRDPDFYKIFVANHILGGSSLTSRLAKTVRDNSGLVYTIYSYYDASYGKGEFGIYFGSNSLNVDKAVNLIKNELIKFVKEGISQDELTKAKKSLIDSFISRNLSTYSNISNTLLAIEFYSLGKNYVKDYPNIIQNLKLNEVNQAIKNYFYPDNLQISIAGEYQKQKSGVKAQKAGLTNKKKD